jgi:hypothetical protein
MKKVNVLTALMAVVSFVCGNVVLTGCSEQKAIAPDPVIKTQTEYKTLTNTIAVGNYGYWSDGKLVVNGTTAVTASITPDSLIMEKPAAEHKASQIVSASTNYWKDSNGNGFSGSLHTYDVEGLTIGAAITPAEQFSKLTNIHPKVSMVEVFFRLQGSFEFLLQDGKIDYQQFDLPINGMYFLSDPTVDVQTITKDSIQIQWKDSIIYKDSVVYVDRIEKIEINHNHNRIVVSGLGYANIFFSVDDAWMKWNVTLDSTFIGRTEENFGKATVLTSGQTGFTSDDTQRGVYTSSASGMNATATTNGISFTSTGDNSLKMGTVSIDVNVDFTNTNGEKATETISVNPFYFHKLIVKAEPSVVTPEITTEHVYEVDTVPSVVKDSEGHITGEKLRVTVKKDGEVWFKAQYMRWETGLLNPTITGTQVGGNNQLRATEHNWDEYKVEGWWGSEDLKGATLTAYAREFHFNTPFPKVPGFGGSEEAVAKSNIVFGTRDFYLKDAETGWELSIPAGKMDVKVIQDEVGTDEAAKAEINARGLEYEYCGTHFLSVEQYVNGKLVNTQSRNEQLLSPKN